MFLANIADTVQDIPHLTQPNGYRCVPEPGVCVEEVLVINISIVNTYLYVQPVSVTEFVQVHELKVIIVFQKMEQLINQLSERFMGENCFCP